MFIIQQYETGDWTLSDTNTRYSRPLNSSEIQKLKVEFPLLAKKEVITFTFCIDRMQSVKVHNSLSMKRRFPKNIPGYRKPLTSEQPRIKKIPENGEITRVNSASNELSLIGKLRLNAYKRLAILPPKGLSTKRTYQNYLEPLPVLRIFQLVYLAFGQLVTQN